MNKRIQYRLATLAEREIPDSSDVWPKVQEQIRNRQKMEQVSRRSLPRLAWTAVALVMLVLFGLAAYAGARSIFDRLSTIAEPNDGGMHAVYEEGLYQEVNSTYAYEGVSVSIDWVYADPIRIIIGWHDETEDQQFSAMLETLNTAGGQVLVNSYAIGDIIEPEERKYFHTFLAPVAAQSAESIDVEATFAVRRSPITGRPPGNGWVQDELGNWTYEYEALGSITLPLSIPVTEGRVIAVGKTVEAAGIPMTLERLILSPSATRADVCFEVPDADAYYWGMDPEARPFGNRFEANFRHYYQYDSLVDGRTCLSIVAMDVKPAGTERIALEVRELYAEDKSGTGERVEFEGPWQFEVGVIE